MTPDARRLEELGLNSSAPPGQLLYDGWLLRLAPGKAKRARSVNAVYPSRLPLDEKIASCERLYGRAKLPTLFRITPFSEPSGLDEALAARGYGTFDHTAVDMASLDGLALGGTTARPLSLPAWTAAVAELRGSPAAHRDAHLARLQGTFLAMRPMAIEEGRRIVATGLTIVEGDCAGLFDIVTREDVRRRGHARALVTGLLAAARELGARHAYLQVNVDNIAARRLYAGFGFAERYVYWYRARPGEQH